MDEIEIPPGPYDGGWLHDPPTESEYDEESTPPPSAGPPGEA